MIKWYWLFNIFIVPVSSTSIFISTLQSFYEVSSNITLCCIVTELNSSLIDINTTLKIQWSSQKESVELESYYTWIYNKKFEHILSNVNLSNAGVYNCSYYITSAKNNSFVIQSNTESDITNVTVKSELFISE